MWPGPCPARLKRHSKEEAGARLVGRLQGGCLAAGQGDRG